jgi:hypothetical protein
MPRPNEYESWVRSVRDGLECDREALLSGTCFIRRRENGGDWEDITAAEVGRLTVQIERLSDILVWSAPAR